MIVAAADLVVVVVVVVVLGDEALDIVGRVLLSDVCLTSGRRGVPWGHRREVETP